MINDEQLQEAVDIITEKILTPVLYMYIDNEVFEFVCFPDNDADDNDFAAAEAEIFVQLGIIAEIVDIRSFDESDRVEITQTAELVYSATELCHILFEKAMFIDEQNMLSLKREIVERKNDTGTYYLN